MVTDGTIFNNEPSLFVLRYPIQSVSCFHSSVITDGTMTNANTHTRDAISSKKGITPKSYGNSSKIFINPISCWMDLSCPIKDFELAVVEISQ